MPVSPRGIGALEAGMRESLLQSVTIAPFNQCPVVESL